MDRKKLDQIFTKNNLDLILSISEQTRLWYADVQASEGQLLFIEKEKATIFLDSRYIEYGKKNAKNVQVNLLNQQNIKKFIEEKQQIYKRIGVEKEYLTLDELERFKKFFPKSEFVLISAQEMRIVKSKEEIQKLKDTCAISLKALEQLKKEIKPGLTEKEVSNKLAYLLLKNGASKNSFDSIVVSGKNASMPHGKPSNKKIEQGDILTIDFGALYKGYAADITRTFFVEKPQNKELETILEIVKEAQRRGIEAVKPGIKTSEIDKVCRDYITQKGYGQYFSHSTGHGLGIDVHEMPFVSSYEKISIVLEPGMVITVEPGIYVENLGGARMEDDILVTENGFEILSKLEQND